jgi:hypothetical protein
LRFQRANLDDEKRWKSPERKWRKRKTTDEWSSRRFARQLELTKGFLSPCALFGRVLDA